MDSALRESIRQRANHCCEYCRMPQEYDVLPFQIDHIISAIGRTTIDVLSINLPERVELRRTLMAIAQANLFIPLDEID